MKKAISYRRISDKDQSRWSLDGQADNHTEYAAKNDIEILAVFTDKGQSAKNFDRADWKELETFVKQNHQNVDFLLVYDWTRFSRNTKEALQMIELLEGRYNIRIISTTQPIGLHPDSPYFHHLRSQMIQNGELELRIIRDRTKFGMMQAAKNGRYVSTAPFGYINARDDHNNPVLVIHEEKAEVIRDIYNRFLSGEPIAVIRQAVNKYTVRGKSAMQATLQNPLYMGYVRKAAYYDEPEALVKGLHQPIIDEDTWWKVHAIFHQKKPVCRTTLSDTFPLRGVLKCYCGRNLTAANSKGRKEIYGYYKCNVPAHRDNLPSKKLHDDFDEILKELSLPKFHIQYLEQKVYQEINVEIEQQQKQLQEKSQQLIEIEKKIDNLEEKYFAHDIDKATYSKWKMRYHTDKSLLQSQLTDLRRPISQVWDRYNQNLDKLADLHYQYHELPVQDKQGFVRHVFDSKLYYQDNSYRTTYIMPIFEYKALKLKEKKLLILEQPELKTANLEGCAPHSTSIEPLYLLLDLFNNSKTG